MMQKYQVEELLVSELLAQKLLKSRNSVEYILIIIFN